MNREFRKSVIDGSQEEIFTAEDGTYKYTHGCEMGDGPLRVNASFYMTDDRFLLLLKRLRKYVEKTEFDTDDSNDIGNKHTHCSWGLCCDEVEVYPDKQDWIWPERELICDKVAPIHFKEHQLCPHDTRTKSTGSGCFYTCRYRKVFNRSIPQDRKLALHSINKRITEFEQLCK